MKSRDACGTCGARATAVLCSGEGDALSALARVHHQHRYQAKQTLYHEDTPALGLFVLCSGRIKVSRTEGNGREQILRLVDPGAILGEEALIESSRYVGSAQALEDSQAAFIAREDALRLLHAHSGMAMNLLRHLCRVLAATQAGLTRVALADARSRMAGLLLDLSRRYGQRTREGVQLSLNVSRGEMAAMIGLTPETAMRLLSEFRDEGILRTDQRKLTLLQPERLEAHV
jgi:CRP-like cAMP-binding protein